MEELGFCSTTKAKFDTEGMRGMGVNAALDALLPLLGIFRLELILELILALLSSSWSSSSLIGSDSSLIVSFRMFSAADFSIISSSRWIRSESDSIDSGLVIILRLVLTTKPDSFSKPNEGRRKMGLGSTLIISVSLARLVLESARFRLLIDRFKLSWDLEPKAMVLSTSSASLSSKAESS